MCEVATPPQEIPDPPVIQWTYVGDHGNQANFKGRANSCLSVHKNIASMRHPYHCLIFLIYSLRAMYGKGAGGYRTKIVKLSKCNAFIDNFSM